MRDECLNAHWFLSLEDAIEKIETWRKEYNEYMPHSSLNDLTPVEFIERSKKEKEKTKALPGAPSADRMIFLILHGLFLTLQISSDQMKVSPIGDCLVPLA